MKKKTRFNFLIVLLVIILLSHIPSFSGKAFTEPVLDTDKCFAYSSLDLKSGIVLHSYNPNLRIFPASTTKLMTALVAIENCPLDSVFTVSEHATRFLEEGSTELDLKAGEIMDFYSLLHALLIRSYNDVALVIAENVAGSEEAFVEMMNQKAQELGALNTHFVAPHGLHDDDHYSTVEDLGIIAKAAFSNFTLTTICSKREYQLPATNMTESFKPLKNTNLALGTNPGYDFVVTAGKTGYTSKAKNLLVALAIDYTGREVISVLSGVEEREDAAQMTLDLFKRSYDDFFVQSIAKAGEIIGSHQGIQLANANRIDYLMPASKDLWSIEKKEVFKSDIDYDKVEVGDVLGYISYYSNNRHIGDSIMVAASSLKLVEDSKNPASTKSPGLSSSDNEKTIVFKDEKAYSIYSTEFFVVLSISILVFVIIILFYFNIARIGRKNRLALHANKQGPDNDDSLRASYDEYDDLPFDHEDEFYDDEDYQEEDDEDY